MFKRGYIVGGQGRLWYSKVHSGRVAHIYFKMGGGGMLREGRLDSGSVAYSKPSGEGKIHNLSRGMYNIS